MLNAPNTTTPMKRVFRLCRRQKTVRFGLTAYGGGCEVLRGGPAKCIFVYRRRGKGQEYASSNGGFFDRLQDLVGAQ